MTSVHINLPTSASVMFNNLVEGVDIPARYLRDDLFAASLPDDVYVHVGWFPEFDPTGQYVVEIFRKDADNPVRSPLETRDIRKVVKHVELLASQYADPPTEMVCVQPSTPSPVRHGFCRS